MKRSIIQHRLKKGMSNLRWVLLNSHCTANNDMIWNKTETETDVFYFILCNNMTQREVVRDWGMKKKPKLKELFCWIITCRLRDAMQCKKKSIIIILIDRDGWKILFLSIKMEALVINYHQYIFNYFIFDFIIDNY